MTETEIVLSTLPRIMLACRVRELVGAETTVSAHQGRILAQVDRDDPTMVTELAAWMGVTPSTMSLNLKRLREAGLVVCDRDPEDRRVMNVRLTEAGERTKAALRPLDIARVEAMLGALWPEDRRRALDGLAALADAADAVAATNRSRVSSI